MKLSSKAIESASKASKTSNAKPKDHELTPEIVSIKVKGEQVTDIYLRHAGNGVYEICQGSFQNPKPDDKVINQIKSYAAASVFIGKLAKAEETK